MAKIKSVLLRFSPDTSLSSKTLRVLRKKMLHVIEWCSWVGIQGVTIEMDVEVEDDS